jgi:hypothetical protein
MTPAMWIFLFISEKGGVRKSATLIAFLDYLSALVSDFLIYEIDDQTRLRKLFPGRVTTIQLPDIDAVRHDDLADVEALSPLIDQILDRRSPIIAVDVAGSVDARVLETLLKLDIAGAASESGYKVAVFTPFLLEHDAMLLATRSIKRATLVLPDAVIVPVLAETGDRVEDLSKEQQRLGKAIEGDRLLIKHPRLLPRALAAVEKTGQSPYRLAEMSLDEATKRFIETGTSRALARGIWSELVTWQDAFRGQFDRLPFPEEESIST